MRHGLFFPFLPCNRSFCLPEFSLPFSALSADRLLLSFLFSCCFLLSLFSFFYYNITCGKFCQCDQPVFSVFSPLVLTILSILNKFYSLFFIFHSFFVNFSHIFVLCNLRIPSFCFWLYDKFINTNRKKGRNSCMKKKYRHLCKKSTVRYHHKFKFYTDRFLVRTLQTGSEDGSDLSGRSGQKIPVHRLDLWGRVAGNGQIRTSCLPCGSCQKWFCRCKC